jgi:hypothetical protein
MKKLLALILLPFLSGCATLTKVVEWHDNQPIQLSSVSYWNGGDADAIGIYVEFEIRFDNFGR